MQFPMLASLKAPFSRVANRPEDAEEEAARQARDHWEPSDADNKKLQMVREKYDISRAAKEPYLRVWATAFAFYCGDQHKNWEPHTRKLVYEEGVSKWSNRVTANQTTTIALTIASKLIKPQHVTTGRPNNPEDPEDVQAADIATHALRHLDEVTNRRQKRRKLELEKVIYGTSFLVPYWDPEVEAKVAFEQYDGRITQQKARVGDQRLEVESVWTIFPQPTDEWDDVRWVIRAKWRTIEWIRDKFPERGLAVSEEAQGEDVFGSVEMASKTPSVAGYNPSNAREKGARVLEYWEKPCRNYPQGRHIVIAGNVILFEADRLPHPTYQLEIFPQFGIYVPGRLWGKGWIEDIVELQKELNKTKAQLIDAKDLTSKPKWKCAKEAQIDPDAITDEPGEIVLYTYGAGNPGPEPMIPPSIPMYVAEMPEKLIDLMRSVAGTHDVSHGSLPSGVKSGIAIDLLQQTDNERLSVPNDMAGDSWKLLDQCLLESIQVRYDEPRLVRILGKDKAQAVISFMGADLRGNTEVELSASEGVTDSIAALRQRVMDYRAAGFFDLPAPILVGVFRIMNENGLAQLIEKVAAEAAAAQEAQMMEPTEEPLSPEEALAGGQAGPADIYEPTPQESAPIQGL